MITKQKLTKEELDDLEERGILARIALPMVMILFLLLLRWIFGLPGPVFWFMTVFILALSLYAYFAGGKQKMEKDMEEGVKLVRSGTIVDVKAEIAGPYKPVIESINITLEKETPPDPYPQHHTFCIYNANGSLYIPIDHGLRKRYKKLKGQTVELEYFPYSGHVLSFEEEGKLEDK